MSDVEYMIIEGLPDEEVLSWVVEVSDNAYSHNSEISEYQRMLEGKRGILTCIALDKGTPVGFKIGYEERPFYFESWRGGVVESARRKGIGEQLMRHQHAWCEQQGYRIISTTCDNENTSMMILNLRNGLLVTGTLYDRKENMKVIFQKYLGCKKQGE